MSCNHDQHAQTLHRPLSSTLPDHSHPCCTTFHSNTPHCFLPQLSLVLDDRDLLLEHLARLMKPCDLDVLVRDMHIVNDDASGSFSGDGSSDGGDGGGGDGSGSIRVDGSGSGSSSSDGGDAYGLGGLPLECGKASEHADQEAATLAK